MKIKHFLAIAITIAATSCGITAVPAGQNEAWYVNKTCEEFNGVQEYRNADGATRTDCFTEAYSMEFDFAKKWYECLTQAEYYAKVNGNRPACVLIVEDPVKDEKYYDRAVWLKKETCSPVEIIIVNIKDFKQ